MSLDNRVKAEPCAGSFGACLVDGNTEQTVRERKIKRRALAISISLQTVGLAALVIAPLLAKPAELAVRTVPPMPIYSSRPVHSRTVIESRPRVNQPCFKCAIDSKPTVLRTSTAVTDGNNGIEDGPVIPMSGGSDNGGIPILDPRTQPIRPAVPVEQQHVVHVTHLDPALLTHRVEPVFPTIAHQIRRNGKVELRALIGTDGNIQSLQVVSGDPLFVQSALDAVRQWRYKATMLNGVAVEVDTYITVIYILQQ